MDWNNLVAERNAWIDHNFPGDIFTHSVFGTIEEVGELTHAYLKMKQGIRGTREDHLEAIKDAIADATIYMLGVIKSMPDPELLNRWEPIYKDEKVRHPDDCLLMLSASVGKMARSAVRFHEGPVSYVTNVIYYLRVMAGFFELDYDLIVYDTWNQVRSRDWIKFPTNGKDH